ncbi:hypothetical protein [Mangrovibrevibacter kandeliae]|uniref:hypothetical protein n=1 Tax=Mangrovibrevibacter kandeliae TaxID=2968473 RepID=UPI00389A0F37
MMKFKVIEGGLADGPADGPEAAAGGPVRPDQVAYEAARRIRAIGFDAWRIREFATGRPMPREIRYLQLQISFVGEALARLDPIPEDYRADRYWPKLH